MRVAWVYVGRNATGSFGIIRGSDPTTTFQRLQTGEFSVEFLVGGGERTCIAGINEGNGVGFISATPGDRLGLPANQVRVFTFAQDGTPTDNLDFSLAVFFDSPEFPSDQS